MFLGLQVYRAGQNETSFGDGEVCLVEGDVGSTGGNFLWETRSPGADQGTHDASGSSPPRGTRLLHPDVFCILRC
jgi:hypothetical protein